MIYQREANLVVAQRENIANAYGVLVIRSPQA